ncbi:hypothetical protein HX021_04160 [Sphingobacterium sp. N143]|uniref:hypothetical protein n=1 Tax=Sphingobacterium sp. N143 TaxID=2746727 RepID=UPI0025774DE1|nr:hypothetical protein [Sphingobacterium sp. N143]MDM1293487.1 hypothetical protein [Sphingobacterium sp. N143]
MKRINLIYTLIASTLLLTNCKKNEISQEKLLNNNSKKTAVAADGKWDLLGYGYDVTGEYLHLKSASTLPVIDMTKIENEKPNKIYAPTTTEGSENYFYGANASKFIEDINIKKTFNVSATIGTKEPEKEGQLYFTPSLGTEKENQNIKEVYSRQSYGRYESVVRVKKIQFTDDITVDFLKNYLTANFKSDIISKSPEELIFLYKTHVLLDISLGGRLLFNYTANISNETTTEKKRSKVEGGLGFFVKKFGINFKTSKTTDEMRQNFNESRERQMYLKFYGGTGSGRSISYDSDGYSSETINISTWQQSINKDNCALVDIQRMVPLYEFIDNPTKKAQVKAAILKHIKDNQITELGEVPIYQYYSSKYSNHYFSKDNYSVIPGVDGNFKNEGVAFYAFSKQKTGLTPIYQYYSSKYSNHYFSKDNYSVIPGVDGNYKNEGIAFYAYPTLNSIAIPIFQYYSSKYSDHYFSSTNVPVINSGDGSFKNEKIAFYGVKTN